MSTSTSLRLLVSLLLVTMTATAGVVFDNSATTTNLEGWAISSGVSVSDSFTLPWDSTLTGINFWAWMLTSGDSLNTGTVDWSIGTAPFAGTSATATVSAVSLGANVPWGVTIDLATFSLPNITLAAGTYYLTLQNATSTSSGTVLWDENDGAGVAAAWLNDPSLTTPTQSLATFCATNTCIGSPNYGESFQLLGEAPEPGTWMLFAPGIALAAALRRKMIRRW